MAVQAFGPRARVMPLRGVLLSAAGLLDPASRPLQDVDILLDGMTLGSGVARLARNGFRVERSKRNRGTVVLSHAMHEALWLDVHPSPLPPWFGRVTSSYLFADAHANSSLFGAQVYVPSHARLMVHLIAYILKDGVVRAYRHAATDVAAVAEVCSLEDIDEVAEHLRRLSLLEGSLLAVLWAHSLTDSSALAALARRLEPDAKIREACQEELLSLGTHGASEDGAPGVRRPSKALRVDALGRMRRGLSNSSWPVHRSWLALRAWLVSPVRK